MTIHIFNPEHDIAMAENNAGYVPPKAARQLASDLSTLPSLWAEEGDIIVTKDSLPHLVRQWDDVRVLPWGWDRTVRRRLLDMGVPASIMPDDEQLDAIRMLSNRSLAVELLDTLRNMPGTTGLSRVCYTYDDVMAFLEEHMDIVVKAPWSSSGRGVRYVNVNDDGDIKRWIKNIIQKQGSIIAEIRCQKVHDFAVEFEADAHGKVKACGLSVFSTERNAYKGNWLATEEKKRQWLSQYIPLDILDSVTARIESFMAEHLQCVYQGPFGVDMMVCEDSLLNPCVEINLRNTMGHVALALARRGHRGFMNITYEDSKFKLTIENKQNNWQ